jgi:hypothetical protein
MLTTHLLLVPRLRNSRSYTSSPSKCLPRRVAGTLYLHIPKINWLMLFREEIGVYTENYMMVYAGAT